MSSIEMDITRRIHASARYLDDQDFDAFLACFSNDGVYLITVKSPELRNRMTWMRRSRQELAERLGAVDQHEWEIVAREQSRLLSVDNVDIDGDQAHTSSGFVLYHTDEAGRSSLYAIGRYEDDWQQYGDDWHIVRREVVLKTRQLEVLSPLPI